LVPLYPRFDPSDLGPRERRERLPGAEEERHRGSNWVVGPGALACPSCDLPLAPGPSASLGDPTRCPYCGHGGPVRDFLSLGAGPIAGRVEVVARLG
jgi:hypothetical protein